VNRFKNESMKNNLTDAWTKALLSAEFDVVATLDYKGGTTRQSAEAAARVFWSRLDRMAFGSARTQRHGACLKRACYLDLGHNRRPADHEVKLASTHAADTRTPNWHYHVYVRSGGKYDAAQKLVDAMRSEWGRIEEAGSYGIIEPYDPQKGCWASYLARKTEFWCHLTSTWIGNQAPDGTEQHRF
jgi:hypothetical protein